MQGASCGYPPFSQPFQEIAILTPAGQGKPRPREVRTGTQGCQLPRECAFPSQWLPTIVPHRALWAAAGRTPRGCQVVTLHTMSCRVFTSGSATANIQSQPALSLDPSSKPAVLREGKLKRKSAESFNSGWAKPEEPVTAVTP